MIPEKKSKGNSDAVRGKQTYAPWDGVNFHRPEREFHPALYACPDLWNVQPNPTNPPPSISYSRIPSLLYFTLDRFRYRDIDGNELRNPFPIQACFHLTTALGLEWVSAHEAVKKIRALRLRFLSSNPQGTAQETRIHQALETGTPLVCPCLPKKHLNIRVREHCMWGFDFPDPETGRDVHVTGFNEIKKELALDDRVLVSVCGFCYLSRVDNTPEPLKEEMRGYLSTFFAALWEKATALENMMAALERSRGVDGDPLRGVDRDRSIGDLYLKAESAAPPWERDVTPAKSSPNVPALTLIEVQRLRKEIEEMKKS